MTTIKTLTHSFSVLLTLVKSDQMQLGHKMFSLNVRNWQNENLQLEKSRLMTEFVYPAVGWMEKS